MLPILPASTNNKGILQERACYTLTGM